MDCSKNKFGSLIFHNRWYSIVELIVEYGVFKK
jgi:hypothetical protein